MGFSSSKNTKSLDKSFEKIIFTVENNGLKGTGFFCKLKIPRSDDFLPVLITSNQLYTKEDFYIKKEIQFKINESIYSLFIDDSRKSYINNEIYKIAFLEIKKEDNLDIDSFLELETEEEFKSDKLYKNKSLGLVTYNKEKKIFEALKFNIKNINSNQYDFEYICNLHEELTGYPIINIKNNKIFGMHQKIDKINKLNNGILLGVPISDFFYETWKNEVFDQKDFHIFKSTITLDATVNLDKMEEDKEILIAYELPNHNKYKKLKLFGEEFVKKNKEKCNLILYDGKKDERIIYELCSELSIELVYNLKISNTFFSIKFIAKEDLTDLSSMFKNCIHLSVIENFQNLNVEKITTMTEMFEGCENLISIKFSALKTSSLNNMSYMFKDCSRLQDIDLSGWNTSNVTTIKGLFQGCKKIKTIIGLEDFDVSNVIDMSFSFCSCKSLRKIHDISQWNTGKVTTMESMFDGCFLLENLPDISGWDISNVKNISNMFKSCQSIVQFPNISKWNVKNVENMTSLFQNCKALKKKPNIKKWNLSNLKYNIDIFKGCKSLQKD